MKQFTITPPNASLRETLQQKINSKTKPPGSLGLLEDIALQIGLIQNTLTPKLAEPTILIFAGDHGLVNEKVSPYPQEVTMQMVMNFLSGGAAINVFSKQHGIKLHVIDAGVNFDFDKSIEGLVHQKIGHGTANAMTGPAMSIAQAQQCIEVGAAIAKKVAQSGCTIIGFGEMGIGNTSAAALLMSSCCNLPVEQCAGRGTGLNDAALNHKINVLKQSRIRNGSPATALEILATYGGFEIAQMVGAMLKASEDKLIILIDGFIASTAYLIAQRMEPAIKDYCIFCHQSHEQGHRKLLEYVDARPLLALNMRLGEGTGVAVAYPLIQSAVNFLNEMASFESAGVSERSA